MAKLNAEQQLVISRFALKFPLPSNSVTASQEWTHKLCQQLKFSFPNGGWGHKSAGPGRPHSSDVIATYPPLVGWDIILDAGGTNPILTLNVDSMNLFDQIFEEVVAVNFLGGIVDPPPAIDINAKLDYIIQTMEKYHGAMEKYHGEEMAAITAPRITRIG